MNTHLTQMSASTHTFWMSALLTTRVLHIRQPYKSMGFAQHSMPTMLEAVVIRNQKHKESEDLTF